MVNSQPESLVLGLAAREGAAVIAKTVEDVPGVGNAGAADDGVVLGGTTETYTAPAA
jgi:hypothetical protein